MIDKRCDFAKFNHSAKKKVYRYFLEYAVEYHHDTQKEIDECYHCIHFDAKQLVVEYIVEWKVMGTWFAFEERIAIKDSGEMLDLTNILEGIEEAKYINHKKNKVTATLEQGSTSGNNQLEIDEKRVEELLDKIKENLKKIVV